MYHVFKVKRISSVHNHLLKVKARVRARGTRGQNWYSDRKSEWARKKARTQALWLLTLAGDWHGGLETARQHSKPHLMRCMMVSNLDVEQRFANGTQGRILYWHPDRLPEKRKAVSAASPELMCRFAIEAPMSKSEMLADIDFVDVCVRQETMTNVPGAPVQIQLGVVPAYALTVHKTQSLSVKHIVQGCLEGVFAQGQVYVLISRVTDPRNFHLLGVPPIDLIEEIGLAFREAGLDVPEQLRACVKVTNEFEYDEKCDRLRDRLKPRRIAATMIPVRNKPLSEVLNPQPQFAKVLHLLLDWIDKCDIASQLGLEKPPCQTESGEKIIPTDENDIWWLTELQCRKTEEDEPDKHMGDGDEDGPPKSSEDEKADITDDDETMSEEEIPKHAYKGYFEKQSKAKCGIHSLNNVIGYQFCNDGDMKFAVEDYLEASKREGLYETRRKHCSDTGWFSVEIMCHAVNTTSMQKKGRVEYEVKLNALYNHLHLIYISLGAIVNINNEHWVALKSIGDVIWLLDSEKQPMEITYEEYSNYVHKHRAAYPIFVAESMTYETPALPLVSGSSSSNLGDSA